MSNSSSSSSNSAQSAAQSASAAPAASAQAPAGTIDAWDYFAENIDDFTVAKAICDHFDAHPKDLHAAPVDAMALYLRAKVTVKREQVAYAISQRAIEEARDATRLAPALKMSAATWLRRIFGALVMSPQTVVMVGALALVIWFR